MKNKFLSFLTLLCVLFVSVSFGQTIGGGGTAEASTNMIKRAACLAGYSGCSSVAVDLTLSGTFSQKQTITSPDAGKKYMAMNKKIKVTISGQSTSGTYYLPTTIGETVAIAGDAGLGAYNVYIKKTADKEFYLSVSNSNL